MTKTNSLVKFRDLTPEQRKEKADLILSRYENDENIADMAKELGVSTTTVYKLLIAEHIEEWKAVQIARAARDLDNWKKGMKDAKDHLELGKAKELAARASWELERLFNRVYGQKQEEKPLGIVHISIGIDRDDGAAAKAARESADRIMAEKGLTIEHEPAPQEPAVVEPVETPKPKKKLIIYQ